MHVVSCDYEEDREKGICCELHDESPKARPSFKKTTFFCEPWHGEFSINHKAILQASSVKSTSTNPPPRDLAALSVKRLARRIAREEHFRDLVSLSCMPVNVHLGRKDEQRGQNQTKPNQEQNMNNSEMQERKKMS